MTDERAMLAARARVALVLGAGNVASIGPLDVVHKLFVEGQVALLKLNPVNEYLGPFFEEAFADLIEAVKPAVVNISVRAAVTQARLLRVGTLFA